MKIFELTISWFYSCSVIKFRYRSRNYTAANLPHTIVAFSRKNVWTRRERYHRLPDWDLNPGADAKRVPLGYLASGVRCIKKTGFGVIGSTKLLYDGGSDSEDSITPGSRLITTLMITIVCCRSCRMGRHYDEQRVMKAVEILEQWATTSRSFNSWLSLQIWITW